MRKDGKKLKCYTGSILFKCSSKHLENEAAKWNRAIIHFIIYTCLNVFCEKDPMDNEQYNG